MRAGPGCRLCNIGGLVVCRSLSFSGVCQQTHDLGRLEDPDGLDGCQEQWRFHRHFERACERALTLYALLAQQQSQLSTVKNAIATP